MKFLAVVLISLMLVACGGGGSEDPTANSVPLKSMQATVTADTNGLYQFFAVAFDAAPGVTYMGQLLEAANYGLTLKEIVNIFTTKFQFTDVYPTTLSNADFAIKLVNNVVGTSATAQAKASAVNDIVAALALPSWTRGDVIFAIFSNLANKLPTDPDWAGTSQQVKDQVAIAKIYTEVFKIDTTDLTQLRKAVIPPHAIEAAASTTSVGSVSNGVAIHMYQALYGQAPSNAMLMDYTGQAVVNPSAFAQTLVANFTTTSDANLAQQVLNNLGITSTSVNSTAYAAVLDAVGRQFAGQGPAARGQIILNITNLLANLESDATYGSVAATYNNQAAANFAYSSDPASAIAVAISTAGAALPPVAAGNFSIFADRLADGWSDWSWGVTDNLSNTKTVHTGTSAIAVTLNSGWGALYLHADSAVSTSTYGSIQFWINGGQAGGQHLQLVVNPNGDSYPFTPSANAWTLVNVPLSSVGNPATLTDLYFQDASGGAQSVFYVDDVMLVAGSSLPPISGPALSVDAASGHHAISSDIYGINLLSDEALAKELGLPVRRWGGNQATRYNWQNDTYSTAGDWFFENIPEDNPNASTLPDGSTTDRFVEQDQRTGSKTLMTVPTIGWVAKRRTTSHPYDCGFSVKKYGAQQSTDQWDPDCGNGVLANGRNIIGNDPTDTSTAVSASFVAGWVSHLVAKYGTAANGGVAYYAFDNEPMIWHSTHRDVHPLPATYDEIRDKTYQYGAAIKSGDPSSKTLGPVEDGWCRYLYSGADNCGPGADFLAHGAVEYVAWYLQQMKSYEQANGRRILDYFDLHYYPSANGVSLSPAGASNTQALRLRSTRSLWDPSYIDESWISDTAPSGVAVKLIPRMKQWVTENYPGTKLAISEYNWGAPESINGAIAQADVLGIFGREGLDLATFWGDVLSSQPLSFAYRMFRNYDGLGHGFGETSVNAGSEDQSTLAVYSALRNSDGALTILVVNKTANALRSSVSLSGFSPKGDAPVYRYSTSNLSALEHAADQTISSSGFTASFPAYSITIICVP